MAWPFSSVVQPNVDPEVGAVPTSATALETVDVWIMGMCFTNGASAARTVTVTNTAGTEIVRQIDVPTSGVPVVIEMPFMRVLGLKWSASGASVVGKIWGYK